LTAGRKSYTGRKICRREGMVDVRDVSWEEEMGTPPTSVRGGQQGTSESSMLMASIRRLKTVGSKAYGHAKGMLTVLKKKSGNIYRGCTRPRGISWGLARSDQPRDSDGQSEDFASKVDITLPPSKITQLHWKEGKLSDSRWWYPFSQNRKQKYADIQKIIGDGKLRPPQPLEVETDDEDAEIAFPKPPTHCPEVF